MSACVITTKTACLNQKDKSRDTADRTLFRIERNAESTAEHAERKSFGQTLLHVIAERILVSVG